MPVRATPSSATSRRPHASSSNPPVEPGQPPSRPAARPAAPNPAATAAASPPGGANVVVLRGILAGVIEQRVLPSGAVVAGFDVRTGPPPTGGPAEVVPVAWLDPPATIADLSAGDELVVVGRRVRRRFFRVGGSTQSRTEVVAEAVCGAQRTKRAAALVEAALQRLAGANP